VSDAELPEDERIASHGALRGGHLAIIALVAVGLLAGSYYWFYVRTPAEQVTTTSGVATVPEGSRTVILYFAQIDEPALFTESRQVAVGKDFVEQVSQVVNALIDGPDRAGVSTIPDGTKLLDVFYDSESFILYLDFSGELVAEHPGGSAAEYFTVAAIMKTVSENFSEIRAVQLLVDGSQVGTIAGHVDAYNPLLVRDWR